MRIISRICECAPSPHRSGKARSDSLILDHHAAVAGYMYADPNNIMLDVHNSSCAVLRRLKAVQDLPKLSRHFESNHHVVTAVRSKLPARPAPWSNGRAMPSSPASSEDAAEAHMSSCAHHHVAFILGAGDDAEEPDSDDY